MFGEIIQIHRPRKSQNDNKFIVVLIRCDDGIIRKTYLCRDYRNYQRWKNLLKAGQMVDGLSLKNNETVDADSFVRPFVLQPSQMTEEEFAKNYL